MNDIARQVGRIERTGRPGRLSVSNLGSLRDISDVLDAIDALWRIFELGDPKQAVNVAAGKSRSIRDVTTTLVRLARVPV